MESKKIAILIIGLFVVMAIDLAAQPFEPITSSFTGLGRSYVAWGDFDNDGDLDVAVCGITTAGDHLTQIYMNGEGAFIDIQAGIKGVKDGSLEWGDYDNDGDLDLLLTGETYDAGNISLIYRNDDGIFIEYNAGFPGIGYGHTAWGDYDNDGDLDVLITGNWTVSLYENIDGSFNLVEQDFGHLQNSRAAWGDFDNDGDLDLLLIGDTGGGYLTVVYLNEDGEFITANLDMEGLFSGSVDWIDFDKDGDLDICVSGYDIFLEPRLLLYENLGDGNIAPYLVYLPGLGISSVDWGDYDNDGDMDILACGKNASCGGGITNVYYNQEGIFLSEPQANLAGAIRCSAAWADYDNDGDLDFLLTGLTPEEVPFSQFYRNASGDNNYTMNTMPVAPDNLESIVGGSHVILSWDKATDEQTPQDGLNYNLRIGTHSGDCDVLSPMANAETGFRYIQAIGNTNTEVSRMIMNLPEGTYYWSVQSIDQAYSGSPFAAEQSFTILETDVDEMRDNNVFRIHPNPAIDKVYLQSSVSENIEYCIFNINGQEVIKGSSLTGESIDVSSLIEGVYFMHLQAGSESSVQRLIKQ